jgi:hypothetical protein
VNWTAVFVGFITGGTAVLVGWFGYLGVRRSTAIELRKMESGSAERLEARQVEDLQRRRELYHQFLNEERSVFPSLDEDAAEEAMKATEAWVFSMYESVNGIILTAPLEVATAARDLHSVLARINFTAQEAADKLDDESFAKYRAALEKWSPSRNKLIDAMRADVAPDRRPFERGDDK